MLDVLHLVKVKEQWLVESWIIANKYNYGGRALAEILRLHLDLQVDSNTACIMGYGVALGTKMVSNSAQPKTQHG